MAEKNVPVMTHQLPGLSQNEPIIVISVSNVNFRLKREKFRQGRSNMGCRPLNFLLQFIIFVCKNPIYFLNTLIFLCNTSFAILIKINFIKILIKIFFLSNEPNTGHEVTTDQFSEKSCSVSYVA